MPATGLPVWLPNGVDVDPRGRIWVSFHSGMIGVVGRNGVERIIDTWSLPLPYPGAEVMHANEVAFDAAGNAYVGDYAIRGAARKLSPNGDLIANVILEETDHLDVSADGCHVLYQGDGSYNMGQTIGADLCGGGFSFSHSVNDEENEWNERAQGVRFLPDGSILINNHRTLDRVTPAGVPIRRYEIPNTANGLTLSPDGRSFWLCNKEYDVETGALLRTLPIVGCVRAVVGEYYPWTATTTGTGPRASVVQAHERVQQLRAATADKRARTSLTRTDQALSDALAEQCWDAGGNLVGAREALPCLRALRTAALRIQLAPAATRAALAGERDSFIQVVATAARTRFDHLAAATLTPPSAWRATGPTATLWHGRRTLATADSDPDRVRATLRYISAFERLL
jgi:hypothetical protein